jgi:hypothetical protein
VVSGCFFFFFFLFIICHSNRIMYCVILNSLTALPSISSTIYTFNNLYITLHCIYYFYHTIYFFLRNLKHQMKSFDSDFFEELEDLKSRYSKLQVSYLIVSYRIVSYRTAQHHIFTLSFCSFIDILIPCLLFLALLFDNPSRQLLHF